MKKKSSVSEEQLRELFEQNFERLRLENGHSLSPEVREAAWEQVRCYWLKLRHIAESVTDTEVKLNLPNQKTPRKRTFCIEGVVDIVRDNDTVTMYDLKTHDLDFVQEHIELYRDQLNVYAHIWQSLRGERLDEAAVIATPVPDEVTEAIRSGDPDRRDAALAAWDPVVPIDFDAGNVNKTIKAFAKVVDQIEDHEFNPPTLDDLAKRDGTRGTFASRVCVNCDLRFSCSSYHLYAQRFKDRNWRRFADFYDPEIGDAESLNRFDANAGQVNDL